MLVVSGMATISVTVAPGAFSGSRVSTGRRRPRPPSGGMHRCDPCRVDGVNRRSRENRVPGPPGMGIGGVTR